MAGRGEVRADWATLAVTLLVSCGESENGSDGGTAGSSGPTGGSASSAGIGGTAMAGGAMSGGRGGASSSGGASGASGSGGASAGSSSSGTCDEVTRNGRCAGNVYEWCDYFTGGIARLDCTPLGATCRAMARQSYEGELNGCIAGPCTTSEASCDGAIASECEQGEVVITDCKKYGGPASTCVVDGTSAGCTRQDCSSPSQATCARDLRLICNEDGLLVIEDCARCDPAGTCVEAEPGGEPSATCDRFSSGCEP